MAGDITNWDAAYTHSSNEDVVAGIIKGDGSGGYSAAVAGVDYAPFDHAWSTTILTIEGGPAGFRTIGAGGRSFDFVNSSGNPVLTSHDGGAGNIYNGALEVAYLPTLGGSPVCYVTSPAGGGAGLMLTDCNYGYTLPTGDGSAGDILVTDGSGNVSWQAPALAELDPVYSGSPASGLPGALSVLGNVLQDDGAGNMVWGSESDPQFSANGVGAWWSGGANMTSLTNDAGFITSTLSANLNVNGNTVYNATNVTSTSVASSILMMQASATPPSPPIPTVAGDIYVDSTANELCYWNGAGWTNLVTGVTGGCGV